jgi:hypothetical protein
VPRISDPLPLEAVRDLLGIVRALWGAAERRSETHRQRILERAGNAIRKAMRMAAENVPGSPEHTRAHRLIDDAIALIGEALPHVDTLNEVLSVAQARACGTPVRRPRAMDRHAQRVKRG